MGFVHHTRVFDVRWCLQVGQINYKSLDIQKNIWTTGTVPCSSPNLIKAQIVWMFMWTGKHDINCFSLFSADRKVRAGPFLPGWICHHLLTVALGWCAASAGQIHQPVSFPTQLRALRSQAGSGHCCRWPTGRFSPAVGTEVGFVYVCVSGTCVWPYVGIGIDIDREAFPSSGRLWSPTHNGVQRNCSPEAC